MELSIIICTCNRGERLRDLFDDFARLEIPLGITWELLIVDNASKDQTPQIIEREVLRRRLPLVCLRQPMRGKSRALNLALGKAHGKIIILTDDDVLPASGWLRAYFEASQIYPSILGFAGKVLPLWESDEMPEWLSIQGKYAIPEPLINRFNFGEKEKLLPNKSTPGGLNAALRKDIIEKIGLFREDIGPGTSFPFSEDTEYFRRLYTLGGRYMYLPKALVYHKNPTDRMTKSYVLKWTFHCNRSDVQIYDYPEVRTFFGVPRYLLRQTAESLFCVVSAVDKVKRFYFLRSFVKCVGEIIGHIQKSRSIKMV